MAKKQNKTKETGSIQIGNASFSNRELGKDMTWSEFKAAYKGKLNTDIAAAYVQLKGTIPKGTVFKNEAPKE